MRRGSLLSAFWFAWRGVRTAFLRERNLWLELIAGILALLLGWALNLSLERMLLVLLASGLVLVLEVVNTAIELLADAVSLRKSQQIGRVKDVSAGAVLLAVCLAVLTGLFVFVRPVSTLLLWLG